MRIYIIDLWNNGKTSISGRHFLTRACNEFGMGMGLGSCIILLENEKHLPDFDMRDMIGDDLPFYANIGFVQLESMMRDGSYPRIVELVRGLTLAYAFLKVKN